MKDKDITVRWCSEGRSEATQARATKHKFEGMLSLRQLANSCSIIISVCPPEHAKTVAQNVADVGFSGIYVDANAIAPETSAEILRIMSNAGASYVDGGIVGPPSWNPGTTRLFLSGEKANLVERLFQGTNVSVVVIPGSVTGASAMKVAYASWTKGTSALLLAVRAFAREHGVEDQLLAEWCRSQKPLLTRSSKLINVAPKAWRFAGEMEQISKAYESVGLPPGFHNAAAMVYQQLAHLKDADQVTVDHLISLVSSPLVEELPAKL